MAVKLLLQCIITLRKLLGVFPEPPLVFLRLTVFPPEFFKISSIFHTKLFTVIIKHTDIVDILDLRPVQQLHCLVIFFLGQCDLVPVLVRLSKDHNRRYRRKCQCPNIRIGHVAVQIKVQQYKQHDQRADQTGYALGKLF